MSNPLQSAKTLPRALAFAQSKGGVGKTTCTSNVGGLAAAAGYHVLIVELDLQGNLSRDLGYTKRDGQELANALINRTPIPIIKDIRPGLDVVPGGRRLSDLAAIKLSRAMQNGGGGADLGDDLYAGLAPIADDYDLILFDTPPGDLVLVNAALKVSRFLVIPTRVDSASIDGLETIADLFADIKTVNTELRLAGVLLYGLGTKSVRIERIARTQINDIIPPHIAPVFDTRIRYLESAAMDARSHGLLIHELEGYTAEAQKQRLQALAAGAPSPESFLARNASGLAGDFASFTQELLLRMVELENEEVSA